MDSSTTTTDQSKSSTTPSNTSKSLLNQDAPKPDAATGAPEKYEAFTVPDGFTLDEAVATEAGTLFKGMNLSQADGQKLVDFYAAKTVEAAQAPFKAWKDTQEAWTADIKADPELGPKLDVVRATVAKAIDGLGDPKLASDFREAMDYTGAGNNPAFIKAFYRLSQKLTEGTHVAGRGPSPHGQTPTGQNARPSLAAAIYPNLPAG